VVVMVGTGEKDKVGWPDATWQKCGPRVSIIDLNGFLAGNQGVGLSK
jgi:hypothetical protein